MPSLNKPTLLLFALLCLNPVSANARVLEQSAAGFVIEIAAEADQPVAASYQQFLRVGEWWDGQHSWFGNADNFYIEPRAGGCFCEVDGDQQVQHMRVVYVEPNKEIRMLGGLGPLQMMAVHGAMSWTFTSGQDGQTLILHRYAVSGYHKDGLDKLAAIVDQVQSAQVERLVHRLANTSLKQADQ
ncbi:MAG: SRPBCC domain-containing protein [Gammaproteobacteria bacterium]|nr:SRPBCC domain-containing protein [Gammaproteobacteria bacterium]